MELDHLLGKYDLTFISILDELFSLRKPRLIEFCKRIKDYKLNWLVQLHVNSADPEILDIMKDSGCAIISYGMESMSLRFLRACRKKPKPRIDLTGKILSREILVCREILFLVIPQKQLKQQ